MKISQAQTILAQVAQLHEANPSLDAADYAKNFIPLNDNNLFRTDSVKGRVVRWVRGYETKRSQVARVEKIFWKAINTIPPEDQVSGRWINLYKLLRKKHKIEEKKKPDHPYQTEIKEIVDTEAEKAYQLMKEKSLLHPVRNQSAPECDQATMREVLGLAPKTEKYNLHLKNYLLANHVDTVAPSNYPQKLEERFQLIQDAKKRDKKFEAEMVPSVNPPDAQKRNAIRATQSQELALQVQNLQTYNSFFVTGSYGRRITNLKTLFEALKALPDSLKHFFPQKVQTAIQEGFAGGHEGIVRTQVKKGLESFISKLPKSQSRLLKVLFNDNARDLPESVKRVLPELLSEPIQKQLSQGLFGTMLDIAEAAPSSEVKEVLDFIIRVYVDRNTDHPGLIMFFVSLTNLMPRHEVLPVLRWVNDNLNQNLAANLLDPDPVKRALAADKLEALLVEVGTKTIQQYIDPLLAEVDKIMEQIRNTVPGFLQRATLMDRIFASGPFWVQVTKQSNDRFTVKVYADAFASALNPIRGNKVVWPITIADVDGNKLNSEFFDTLLYHRFEPLCNSDFQSIPESLYKALNTIGGKWVYEERVSNSSIGRNEADLTQAIIVGEESAPQSLFNMQVDALVTVCRGILRDGSLCFDGKEQLKKEVKGVAETLRTTLEKNPEYGGNRKEAILALIQEIQYVELAAEDPFTQDPMLLARPVAEALRLCGIRKENFHNYGDVLLAVLGEDLMEFIDLCLDSVDPLPEATSTRFPPVPVKVAAKEDLTTIRKLVRNFYFQMIFQTIKYGYTFCRGVSSPLYLAYLMFPAVAKYLPPEVRYYPEAAIALIQASITRLFTFMLVRLLFDVRVAKMIGEKRNDAAGWAKSKISAPMVSMQVEPVTEAVNPKVIVSDALTIFPRVMSDQFYVLTRFGEIGIQEEIQAQTIHSTLKNWKDRFLLQNPAYFERCCQRALEIGPFRDDMTQAEREEGAQFYCLATLHPHSKQYLAMGDTWSYVIGLKLKEESFRLNLMKKFYAGFNLSTQYLKKERIHCDSAWHIHVDNSLSIDMIRGKVSDNNPEKIIDLLNKIRTLPLPDSEDNFWDQIPDAHHCLLALSDIARLFRFETIKEPSVKIKAALAQFHLLAIMDRLARRDPANQLDGFYANASALEAWSKQPVCVLTDAEDVEYLDQLKACFSHCNQAITNDGLFHYAYHDGQELSLSLSPAEAVYLLRLFKNDPAMEHAISEIFKQADKDQDDYDELVYSRFREEVEMAGGDSRERLHRIVRWMKYEGVEVDVPFVHEGEKHVSWEKCTKSDEHVVQVLAFMSHMLEGDSVVPMGYRLLKQQMWQCNNFLIDPIDKVPSRYFKWGSHRIRQILPINMGDVWDKVHGLWNGSPVVRPPRKEFYATSTTYLSLNPYNRFSDTTGKASGLSLATAIIMDRPIDLGLFRAFRKVYRKSEIAVWMDKVSPTQSHVLSSRLPTTIASVFDRDFGTNPRGIGKLIHCESSDRIPRVVNYFMKLLSAEKAEDFDDSSLNSFNLHRLEYFQNTLFQGSDLKNQLLESPSFALVLGELATKIANRKILRDSDMMNLRFAVAILIYCKRYAPNHCGNFPDLLQRMVGNEDFYSIHQYKAEIETASGESIEYLSDDLALALCLGRFASAPSPTFRAQFRRFFNRIGVKLNQGSFALKVAREVLRHNKVLHSKDDLKTLVVENTYAIQIPALSVVIDIQHGRLAWPALDLERAIPHLKHLKQSELGDYKIRNSGGSSEIEYAFEDKRYKAVNAGEMERAKFTEALAYVGITVDENTVLWIEDSRQTKSLLVGDNRSYPKKWSRFNVVQKKDKSFALDIMGMDELVITVPASTGIQQLQRFCDTKQISCERKVKGKHVNAIKIDDYKLKFTVKEVDGKHLAFASDVYPDFFIAPQQDVRHLRPYVNYLLLTNQKGERKVLIPNGHALTAGLWHGLKYMQPFTHLLPARTGLETQKGDYYSYDMDAEGYLSSESPAAVINLILVHLIQQNDELLQIALQQFLAVSKQVPLPAAIWDQLLPMTLILPYLKQPQRIRMRLFAALEENRLLLGNHSKDAPEQSRSAIIPVLFLQALMVDLYSLASMSELDKKIEGQGALSLDKEWYLYKCLFRQARKALKFDNRMPQRILSLLDDDQKMEALIEAMVLPEVLYKRYRMLKEYFGVADSMFLQVLSASRVAVAAVPVSGYSLDPYVAVQNLFVKMFPGFVEMMGETVDGVHSILSVSDELINLSQKFQRPSTLTEKAKLKLREIDLEHVNSVDDFDSQKMTSDLLFSRFIYYYSVARAEEDGRRSLTAMLSRLNLRFDADTNFLIELLEHVSSFSLIYPGSDTVKEALLSPCVLPHKNASEFEAIEQTLAGFNVSRSEQNASADLDSINPRSLVKSFSRLYKMALEHSEEFLRRFKADLIDLSTNKDRGISLLASFLLNVAGAPSGYLSSIEFEDIYRRDLNDFNIALRYPKLEGMWETLRTRKFRTEVTTSGVVGAIATAKNITIPTVGFMALPAFAWYSRQVIAGLPLATRIGRIVQWGLNMRRIIADRKCGSLVRATDGVEIVASPYHSLNIEDLAIDAHLRNLFEEVFESSIELNPDEQPFALIDPSDAAERTQIDRFDRANRNIRDFYVRDQHRVRYKLKDSGKIWKIYRRLSSKIASLQSDLNQTERNLVELVNQTQRRTNGSLITFNTLIQFQLTGDLSLLGEKLSIPVEALQKLEYLLVRHLVRGSRLQQLKRVQAHIEGLAQIDVHTDRANYYNVMERLADELSARRAYKLDSIQSTRLLLRLLCFEYFSNKLIWAKQLERITELLLNENGNQVLELIMSLGKTVFGIPVIDDFEADGQTLVINIWPAGMAETNIRQISRQHRQLFQRATNVLRFTRDNEIALDQLQAIKVLLQGCIVNRETLNMTREELQALELSLIEVLYNAHNGVAVAGANTEQVLVDLRDILLLIRTKARIVGDEAHELFNHAQELNYPVGPPKVIKEKYYRIMEQCIRFLMEERSICEAISGNKKVEMTAALKERIARRFVGDRAYQSCAQDPHFIDYVTGKSAEIPPGIRKHKRFDDIALIKGMLTVLLPNTLSKESFVDHGPSAQGNGDFARPYEGNTRPMENALLRNPYEALTKTFIQFLHTGLSPVIVSKCLVKMMELAQSNAARLGVEVSETAEFILFKKLCPNGNIYKLDSVASYFKDLEKNTDLICFYIENFVYQQIKYWKENACSNSQNFGSIAPDQYHVTGTPYNDGTYPHGLEVLHDKGTTGEALHIAMNKCPENGIRVLSNDNPTQILNEVLRTFFAQGSDFSALIDGSAVLKGIPDQAVAKAILEYVAVHRPDIKAVVFFMRDEFNRDQLVCWEVGTLAPVPLDSSTIPPEARLTYFDHLHGFAADVPQKPNGKAVDLVGDRVTLYRLLQEIFRMRGIKIWKKLKEAKNDDLSDLLGQTQEVHFAMTRETARKINTTSGSALDVIPTFRDIVKFAIMNESKVGEDNYFAYRNKIANEARSYVIELILNAENTKEMHSLFDKHKDILISTIEDNPAQLWGFIDKMEIAHVVIDTLKRKQIDRFKGNEKTEVMNRVNALVSPVMPDKVRICTDGTNSRYDADTDMDRIVTVTTTQNQNQVQNTQQEQLQQVVEPDTKKIPYYKESEWEPNLSPYSDSWKVFLGGMTNYKKNPPLYRLCDVVGKSPMSLIAAVIDPRIWISKNFLPGGASKLGTVEQRELIHLFVNAENSDDDDSLNITSVGCVTLKDAAYWRKRLNSVERPYGQFAFIYDVTSGTITWAEKGIDMVRLRDSDFTAMEVQLKFLNGDTMSYTQHQNLVLRRWIAGSDLNAMREAAVLINYNRNRNKPLQNTLVDLAIKDAENG